MIKAYRLWTLLSALFALTGEDSKTSWENLSLPSVRLMCRFSQTEDKEALQKLIQETATQSALNRLF